MGFSCATVPVRTLPDSWRHVSSWVSARRPSPPDLHSSRACSTPVKNNHCGKFDVPKSGKLASAFPFFPCHRLLQRDWRGALCLVWPCVVLLSKRFWLLTVCVVYSQGAWWVGNAIANVIGGVVAHGIGQITTSPLQHWRLLFLILGAVTAAYAFVLYLFLPDSPTKAIFLNKTQRQVALQRTIHNKTGLLDNDTFVTYQIIDALRDPQLWLLVLYTVSVNLANGGLTSVSCHLSFSTLFRPSRMSPPLVACFFRYYDRSVSRKVR